MFRKKLMTPAALLVSYGLIPILDRWNFFSKHHHKGSQKYLSVEQGWQEFIEHLEDRTSAFRDTVPSFQETRGFDPQIKALFEKESPQEQQRTLQTITVKRLTDKVKRNVANKEPRHIFIGGLSALISAYVQASHGKQGVLYLDQGSYSTNDVFFVSPESLDKSRLKPSIADVIRTLFFPASYSQSGTAEYQPQGSKLRLNWHLLKEMPIALLVMSQMLLGSKKAKVEECELTPSSHQYAQQLDHEIRQLRLSGIFHESGYALTSRAADTIKRTLPRIGAEGQSWQCVAIHVDAISGEKIAELTDEVAGATFYIPATTLCISANPDQLPGQHQSQFGEVSVSCEMIVEGKITMPQHLENGVFIIPLSYKELNGKYYSHISAQYGNEIVSCQNGELGISAKDALHAAETVRSHFNDAKLISVRPLFRGLNAKGPSPLIFSGNSIKDTVVYQAGNHSHCLHACAKAMQYAEFFVEDNITMQASQIPHGQICKQAADAINKLIADRNPSCTTTVWCRGIGLFTGSRYPWGHKKHLVNDVAAYTVNPEAGSVTVCSGDDSVDSTFVIGH